MGIINEKYLVFPPVYDGLLLPDKFMLVELQTQKKKELRKVLPILPEETFLQLGKELVYLKRHLHLLWNKKHM